MLDLHLAVWRDHSNQILLQQSLEEVVQMPVHDWITLQLLLVVVQNTLHKLATQNAPDSAARVDCGALCIRSAAYRSGGQSAP